MKVNLSRLQVVNGVAYHKGERDVPEAVAAILARRGVLIETPAAPDEPTAPTAPPFVAGIQRGAVNANSAANANSPAPKDEKATSEKAAAEKPAPPAALPAESKTKAAA